MSGAVVGRLLMNGDAACLGRPDHAKRSADVLDRTDRVTAGAHDCLSEREPPPNGTGSWRTRCRICPLGCGIASDRSVAEIDFVPAISRCTLELATRCSMEPRAELDSKPPNISSLSEQLPSHEEPNPAEMRLIVAAMSRDLKETRRNFWLLASGFLLVANYRNALLIAWF